MKKTIKAIYAGGTIPFIIGIICGILVVHVKTGWNTPFIKIMSENICLETILFFYAIVSLSWGIWMIATAINKDLHKKYNEGPIIIQYLPCSFITYSAATLGLIIASIITNSEKLLTIKSPIQTAICIVLFWIFLFVFNHLNKMNRDAIVNRIYLVIFGFGAILIVPFTYFLLILHQ